MIYFEVSNNRKYPVNKKVVHRTLKKIFDFFKLNKKKDDKELSIAFVSNLEIKKINNLYRGHNETTDVLSFGTLNKFDKKGKYEDLAEILISYHIAKKQAKENKISVDDEIKRLLIHGLLHLRGYDHKTKRDRIKMESIELKLYNN